MKGTATTKGVINALSERPFSSMVVGDVNGDGGSDNDLVYILSNPDDIILMGLQTPDGAADPFVADNLLSCWQAQFGIRFSF